MIIFILFRLFFLIISRFRTIVFWLFMFWYLINLDSFSLFSYDERTLSFIARMKIAVMIFIRIMISILEHLESIIP